MKHFDENLQKEINTYLQFSENKQAILDKLLEMQQIDNLCAKERGLKEYEIIHVDYAKKKNYIGWFYVTVSINGMKRNVCETKLNYAISTGMENLINYINEAKSNDLRITCRLSESKVDFIFHGYGFCSTSDSYSIEV